MKQENMKVLVDSDNLYTGIINIHETLKQNQGKTVVINLTLRQNTDFGMVERFVRLLDTIGSDFNCNPVVVIENK